MPADMRKRFLFAVPVLLLLSACAGGQTDGSSSPSSQGASAAQEEILPGDVPETDVEAASGAMLAIPERLLAGGLLEIGREDAPVSLLLLTNHSCDYCRRFHREQLPRLIAEFVADGQARVTLVPFQLKKYADSAEHARLSLCAARQGRGRQMHDALFAGAGARADAAAYGLDADMLERCMDDPTAAAEIESQRSWARALGVDLIPTFVIDGQRLTGLPDYADLRGRLEAALRDASRR
jgi:protein-disulfide isomerase